MGENFDFEAMFAELAAGEPEVAAIDADAVKADLKPAKDGLTYAEDFDGANGHTFSRYAMTMAGKHVYDVLIDNFVEVPVPADLGKVPAGVTAHNITIAAPGEAVAMATTGVALRAPHNDGTGTHIDGRTVQAYIYPRAVRFLIQLYV